MKTTHTPWKVEMTFDIPGSRKRKGKPVKTATAAFGKELNKTQVLKNCLEMLLTKICTLGEKARRKIKVAACVVKYSIPGVCAGQWSLKKCEELDFSDIVVWLREKNPLRHFEEKLA